MTYMLGLSVISEIGRNATLTISRVTCCQRNVLEHDVRAGSNVIPQRPQQQQVCTRAAALDAQRRVLLAIIPCFSVLARAQMVP